MFHVFDRAHKTIAGGVVLGEISAFFTHDRIQQILLLAGGALTWLSHFAWSQFDQKRRARQQEEEFRQRQEESQREAEKRAKEARRRDGILDAVATRVKQDIREGKSPPYPELLHLLLDTDDDEPEVSLSPQSKSEG